MPERHELFRWNVFRPSDAPWVVRYGEQKQCGGRQNPSNLRLPGRDVGRERELPANERCGRHVRTLDIEGVRAWLHGRLVRCMPGGFRARPKTQRLQVLCYAQ